jgi:hypothetical protein
MRSQLLFDMDLKTIEKDMERKWHIREGRLHDADNIQHYDIRPWLKIKDEKLLPKWVTRVNLKSLEQLK